MYYIKCLQSCQLQRTEDKVKSDRGRESEFESHCCPVYARLPLGSSGEHVRLRLPMFKDGSLQSSKIWRATGSPTLRFMLLKNKTKIPFCLFACDLACLLEPSAVMCSLSVNMLFFFTCGDTDDMGQTGSLQRGIIWNCLWILQSPAVPSSFMNTLL